jgi:ABC-2 type transport system ATP-binding protein
VATFGAAHDLLQTESLAGQSRAIVRTSTAAAHRTATELGLSVEPTPLQQLVVALCRTTGAPGTAASVRSDLQGVSR